MPPLLAALLVMSLVANLRVGRSSQLDLYYDEYRVNISALPIQDGLTSFPSEVDWGSISVAEALLDTHEYQLLKGSWRGRMVIIKKLKLGHGKVQRLNREVDLLRRIKHPTIIRPIGAGHLPTKFVIFDSTSGTILTRKLNLTQPSAGLDPRAPLKPRKREPFLKDAHHYSVQIARTMIYLHEQFHPGVRIIYRGLSTDNVWAADDGKIMLMEFGGCELVRRAVDEDELFDLPAHRMSWRYDSPEILARRAYNHKTDVFSFAIAVYHMLTGKHPKRSTETLDSYVTELVRHHRRPSHKSYWQEPLVDLLSAMWNADVLVRPNFTGILDDLSQMESFDRRKYITIW